MPDPSQLSGGGLNPGHDHPPRPVAGGHGVTTDHEGKATSPSDMTSAIHEHHMRLSGAASAPLKQEAAPPSTSGGLEEKAAGYVERAAQWAERKLGLRK